MWAMKANTPPPPPSNRKLRWQTVADGVCQYLAVQMFDGRREIINHEHLMSPRCHKSIAASYYIYIYMRLVLFIKLMVSTVGRTDVI